VSKKTKDSCSGGFRFPGCEDWRPINPEVQPDGPALQFGPVTGFGTGISNDGVGPVYVPPPATGSMDDYSYPTAVETSGGGIGGPFARLARVRTALLSVLSPTGNPSPATVAAASLLPLGLVALGAWWIYKRLSR
jgi:hypothetical protein